VGTPGTRSIPAECARRARFSGPQRSASRAAGGRLTRIGTVVFVDPFLRPLPENLRVDVAPDRQVRCNFQFLSDGLGHVFYRCLVLLFGFRGRHRLGVLARYGAVFRVCYRTAFGFFGHVAKCWRISRAPNCAPHSQPHGMLIGAPGGRLSPGRAQPRPRRSVSFRCHVGRCPPAAS